MALTLHAPIGPNAARVQKIMTVAAFAGVELKLTPTYQYGVENETHDYVRNCNPLGRFPALETPEGHIFESNSIARYIARLDKNNTNLYGKSPFQASQVDMWLDFAATEIDTANFPFVLYGFGYGDAPTEEQAAKVDCALTGLEIWLETRTFLVGERISAADICVAFSLQWVFRFHYDYPKAEALTKKFRNVWRLYNTVMQQPQTIEVLKATGGTFGLVKPVEEKKPAAAAAAATAKPKEEKKAAKKDDDEEEDEMPKEEKKANPLDSLPPSPFVLDAFKREYSNTDTRTQAAPWFFANYDAAGYTAFWCKYKYNEDNKMQFMTANLIRGWFQRMEHTRKYAFGIALIVGEEKKHEIRGLWIFRGKGMPEIVREVEDTELFDWEEIPDVQAKKAEITDYFAWEGPTIDKPVLEGRCFK